MSDQMRSTSGANDQITTKVDLREDGILWMVNATVFHPRGLALAITPDGSLYLTGDADEVWVFNEEVAEGGFQAFEAMLERHLSKMDP